MRLTVVGCSGSFPGPGLAGVLLPGRGRPRGRRLRLRRSTSATARSAPLQRHVDLRRRRRGRLSATCTPTTASTCAATTSCRKYHPTAPLAAAPGLRPGRHARPAGARLRPVDRARAWSASSTSATVPPGSVRGRAVHGRRRPGRPPGRGVRACGSRHDGRSLGLLRRHRRRATALVELAAGADLLLAEASFVDGDGQPARACT